MDDEQKAALVASIEHSATEFIATLEALPDSPFRGTALQQVDFALRMARTAVAVIPAPEPEPPAEGGDA